MKAYDFYGNDYPRPGYNVSKKPKTEGGFRASTTSKDEIEDSPPTARSSRHGAPFMAQPGSSRGQPSTRHGFETVTSPIPLSRDRDVLQGSVASSEDRKVKNEKFLRYLKVRGQPPRSSASKSPVPSTKQPISVEDLTESDDPSVVQPKVLIKGLPGSKFNSPVKMAPTHDQSRAAAQHIESEESMDDLSVGHYKKPTYAIQEKRKRFMQPSVERKNEPGLSKVILDSLASQNKRRRSKRQSDNSEEIGYAQTIHDTSDEEIHLLEKSNIKPTSFAASDGARSKKASSIKAAPKDKRPIKETFKLLQLFSPSHPWFLGDSEKEWALVHNISDGVLSIEGKDAISMSMRTGCISLIEYSDHCAMMTIHKSKDNTFGSAGHIHITLASIDDCAQVASAILTKNPTVKLTRKTKLVFCPLLNPP